MDDDHACGFFKFLLNIVVIKFDGHEATDLVYIDVLCMHLNLY